MKWTSIECEQGHLRAVFARRSQALPGLRPSWTTFGGPLQHPSPTRIRQQLQKWDIYGDHVIVDHIETLRKTCVLPLLIILIFAEIEQTAVVIGVRSYQNGEFQDPAETERL